VPVGTTLETELSLLLSAAGLRGSQVDAVAQRLGLDGRGRTTLQVAAERHGYSRERVRQLEVVARRHIVMARPALPVLADALTLLESAVPDDRAFLAGLLAEKGVADRPFDPAGVLVAAELAGVETPLRQHGRFVGASGDRPDRALLRAARLLAAERPVVAVSLLGGLYGLDDDRVRRLLADCRDLRWTGDDRRALCVATPSLERRVASVLRKLLAIAPRVPLSVLDDALRAGWRPVSLPRRVLGGICSSFAWAELDDTRADVHAVVHIDRRRVLSGIEFALARIFLTFGPVLSFQDVIRIGGDEGLNPSSIGVYLTRTPILSRLERGRYALRVAA